MRLWLDRTSSLPDIKTARSRLRDGATLGMLCILLASILYFSVSQTRPVVHEILIGKMVPPFVIGMINGSLYLIIAPLVFGVPFTGSLLLFFLSLAMYMLALIALAITPLLVGIE